MTKPTGKVNSTYRLTEQERGHIALLSSLRLWPKARIAKAYGVSAKTVLVCEQSFKFYRHPSGAIDIRRADTPNDPAPPTDFHRERTGPSGGSD